MVLLFIEIQQNMETMRAKIGPSRAETAKAQQEAVFNSEFMRRISVKVQEKKPLTRWSPLGKDDHLRSVRKVDE